MPTTLQDVMRIEADALLLITNDNQCTQSFTVFLLEISAALQRSE